MCARSTQLCDRAFSSDDETSRRPPLSCKAARLSWGLGILLILLSPAAGGGVGSGNLKQYVGVARITESTVAGRVYVAKRELDVRAELLCTGHVHDLAEHLDGCDLRFRFR